jgi:DNA-binding protein HU-beta
MSKNSILLELSEKTGLKKIECENVFNHLIQIIKKELINGTPVNLVGLGTLRVKIAKPRVARNPRTMEEMIVPERKEIRFKPNESLRNDVMSS